jgi:hypothetical protein
MAAGPECLSGALSARLRLQRAPLSALTICPAESDRSPTTTHSEPRREAFLNPVDGLAPEQ